MTLLVALATSNAVMAIPADPRLRTFKQANGNLLTYRVVGDEFAHAEVSEDGYPIVYNAKSRNYEFAQLKNQRWVESGIVATNIDQRSDKAKAFLAKVNKNLFFQVMGSTAATRRAPRREFRKMNDYPTVGFRRSLVLLIEFSDNSFTSVSNPQEYYTRMLNEDGFSDYGGTGSASQYYRENSHGLFDVKYDVYGPIKADHPHAFYAASDEAAAQLLAEACEKAQKQYNIDFSQYDCNNDGVVDNIFFFYAGYGQADSNDKSVIWPHSWSLDEAKLSLTLDGKKINSYACSNELRYYKDPNKLIPTGVGTFIHEFGHVLGMPDVYSTLYNQLVYNVDNWDLMSSGSYNNDMCTPPNLSAYEKWSLGWEKPQELTLDADSLIYLPETTSGKSLMVTGPTKNEYFFFENRQKKGWDTYIPGHGMLVWHIDNDSTKMMNNNVNNDANHQCIGVVSGSDIGKHAYDTYPGRGNVDHTSLKDWNNDPLPIQAKYIEERDDTVSFVLDGVPIEVGSIEDLQSKDVTDESFSASWKRLPNVNRYMVDLYYYDEDGNKVMVQQAKEVKEPSVAFSSLLADTDYQLSVYGMIGDCRSDTATLAVKTKELYFNKRKVTLRPASDVDNTSFVANWLPLKDATSYYLTVNGLEYSDEMVEQGYDFTNKADGLPTQWKTNCNSFLDLNGYYGAAAPSLRMNKDGSYLSVAYPETMIYDLSFWYRSKRNTGKLYVENNEGGNWETIKTIDNLSTDGETIKVEVPEGCSELRVRYERTSGYVALDDIILSTKPIVRKPVDGYQKLEVGNATSWKVTGLQPNAQYSYVVLASNGEKESVASDEIRLTTGTATGIKTISNGASDGLAGLSISREIGGLSIRNLDKQPTTLYIYNVSGALVKTVYLTESDIQRVHLLPGIYLLKSNGHTRKYVVS